MYVPVSAGDTGTGTGTTFLLELFVSFPSNCGLLPTDAVSVETVAVMIGPLTNTGLAGVIYQV